MKPTVSRWQISRSEHHRPVVAITAGSMALATACYSRRWGFYGRGLFSPQSGAGVPAGRGLSTGASCFERPCATRPYEPEQPRTTATNKTTNTRPRLPTGGRSMLMDQPADFAQRPGRLGPEAKVRFRQLKARQFPPLWARNPAIRRGHIAAPNCDKKAARYHFRSSASIAARNFGPIIVLADTSDSSKP